jgi:hypothetical protein
VAKPRATKAKRKKAAAEEPSPEAPRAAKSVPPKPSSVPPRPRSVPPRAASVRPPPAPAAPEVERIIEPPTPSSVGRWEERGDKDAYALDLLERLVRYYGGRASATSSEAIRSAAVVLSTLSLCLAASEDAQLIALARAAREIRKGGG